MAEELLTSKENGPGDGGGSNSANTVAIRKPNGFDLNKFKSKRADAIATRPTLPQRMCCCHTTTRRSGRRRILRPPVAPTGSKVGSA
jgi:hypothetical protein